MAYSLMAGLPAVYGLYVSFFPVLIYAFLGTARHLSIGSFAITSLMTISLIERLEGKYYARPGELSQTIQLQSSINQTQTQTQTQTQANQISSPLSSSSLYLSDDPTEAKIMISMILTFLVGLIQVSLYSYLIILFFQYCLCKINHF